MTKRVDTGLVCLRHEADILSKNRQIIFIPLSRYVPHIGDRPYKIVIPKDPEFLVAQNAQVYARLARIYYHPSTRVQYWNLDIEMRYYFPKGFL
ncbi:MAG: hypothetical protein M3530_07090 [Thermoproteota archaeon]|nr:hypothetical protein [Thermoproteota archaeon]